MSEIDTRLMREVANSLAGITDREVVRFDSERDRFVSHGRCLSRMVLAALPGIESTNDLFAAAKAANEALVEACEFLLHGTPIRNGSDLHRDLLVCRDQTAAAIAKVGAA